MLERVQIFFVKGGGGLSVYILRSKKSGRFELPTCPDCWYGRWHELAADRCGNQGLGVVSCFCPKALGIEEFIEELSYDKMDGQEVEIGEGAD